jgi:hypothetical protein
MNVPPYLSLATMAAATLLRYRVIECFKIHCRRLSITALPAGGAIIVTGISDFHTGMAGAVTGYDAYNAYIMRPRTRN